MTGTGRNVDEERDGMTERNEKSLLSRSRGGRERKNFWIEDGHRSRDVTHRGRRHRRPTLSISVTVLAARRLIDDRRDGNDISWNAVVVADHFFFSHTHLFRLPLCHPFVRLPLSLFVSLIFFYPFVVPLSFVRFSPPLFFILFLPFCWKLTQFVFDAARLVFTRTLGLS